MIVSEVCSQGVVHVPASCSLQEAARQMAEQHVGALLVTEDSHSGRIAGLVTDRDMVLKAMAIGAAPNEVHVFDVMTPGVLTVAANADVADAIAVMSTHGVRRLAVIDGDGQGIVGVVSVDDVIGALGAVWATLAAIVRSERNREETGAVQTPLHL